MRSFASVLVATGVLLVVAGSTATHAATATTVRAEDFKFVPKTITVKPGEAITFDNTGAVAHTATADSGSFDTGDMGPGNSETITISAPGTYGFYCKYHGSPGSGMAGTIRVAGKGAGPVPQTASPLPLIAVVGVLLLLGALLLRKRQARTA